MLKTSNYNLNKPETNDPLRLEDFNENSNILDRELTALHGAVGAIRYVKLAEVTTTEELGQIDLDVSHIDFTQYEKIELYFTGKSAQYAAYLRVNGISGSSSYKMHSDARSTNSSDYTAAYMLSWKSSANDLNSAVIQFNRPAAGANIGAWIMHMSCHTGSAISSICYGAPYDLKWEELTSFNFVLEYAKTFPAGANVALYGVKR